MAITAIFTPPSMNTAQYDDIIGALEKAGAGSPPGRLHHVCFGSGSNLRVLDIWDSPENFQAFGQTLMPLLHQLGIDPGQPEVVPVHNTIEGRTGATPQTA